MGFPGGSDGKESACNVGDLGSIPGLGRSPGEGNGNPLQYSCLENSIDRGTWWAAVHGVTKSWTRLSNSHTHTLTRMPATLTSKGHHREPQSQPTCAGCCGFSSPSFILNPNLTLLLFYLISFKKYLFIIYVFDCTWSSL